MVAWHRQASLAMDRDGVCSYMVSACMLMHACQNMNGGGVAG